jgi:predicted enzyme related to lactoylglutathione lyase
MVANKISSDPLSTTRDAPAGAPVFVVAHVTIDCADPVRLAAFWSQATGYPIEQQDEHLATLSPVQAGQPKLLFVAVPEPKTAKNRVHLDVGVADLGAAAARLIELGATRGETHRGHGFVWAVMADPEGNEFCIGQPEP